jgi:predicted AAA+ superfamily ATPase
MKMKRLIVGELLKWKASKKRKPLILTGARQVGKTWILKEFGKSAYESYAYFSFDENSEYKQFFETTKDVRRILENLAMASGQKIDAGTLIIFDEIQECPNALGSLKYFYENAPEYHIACAGSLLGLALAKPASFPVGKVEFIRVLPMNFTEFLTAVDGGHYAAYLGSVDRIEPIPDAFFNPLVEKIKLYFIIGGMPEAVKTWAEERDAAELERVLSNILTAYELDFNKHAQKDMIAKLALIFQSVPSQLARENKKFLYKAIREGARAREYEDALLWLVHANIVKKVFRCNEPKLPLASYDDIGAFKIYLGDVGMLRRMALLAPGAIAEGSRLFTEFKGALTENYILNALEPQFEPPPRYWAMDKPRYEVDFLVQRGNDIFPIEVKAETNIESKSLKKYAEIYSADVKLRVRFSLKNLCLNGNVLNIPLFMADYADKLIGIALEEMERARS